MASSSSSSSSSPSRNWIYDVFPSFRGKDVRKAFLSHFLKELDRKFISAFKDNKIEKGASLSPELKLAIKNSSIAVVVLSKNYASSRWCLNELVQILKCKKKAGKIVIPVFYRLDPSHVRNQTGDFGMIFEKTCRNKTERLKVIWRGALTDVANIHGYHSVTWDNEAKMVEEIVSDILGKLLLTLSKDSEDYVGIENHIKKMILLLDFESKQGRMVGIWGPSGIGKTTIGRVLFNRLSRHFQGSVFVDRVFVSKSMGFYSGANPDDYNMKLSLQNKFLSVILGQKDIRIRYLGAVKDRLKNHNVLIIIDDLENQVVLDTLAGHTDWFGRGSRIIVITKDKHLLRAHGIGHIYEVDLPSDGLALEMFCRSAFRQNYPPNEFMELAPETALRAGNLPLGLKVLGLYLRGRNKKEWMDMLLMFQKGQYDKIEEIVKFCYNGMNNKNDEAIFRTIACLFNGERVDDIKSLLADSDLDVDNGIKNLVDKSFINERSNTVEMHSLVQKMGEEIVRTQSDEPGEREFLVDAKEISHVLKDVTGTEKIKGISLNLDELDEFLIHESAFEGMTNLLFLRVSNMNKESICDIPADRLSLGSRLRLLQWEKYQWKQMPSKFCPENLVKIQMHRSKLEELWDGVQSLSGLKDMDLWGSENLKEVPDLSMATNLEKLYLGACSSLVELPSSVQYLNKLKMLDMSFCKKLEILPANINLQALDDLNLSECSRLRCFPGISTNISCLNLSQTGIEEVPWWIENFTKLRSISMRDCEELEYVSLNISKLKHLETIDFSNCWALNEARLNDSISAMEMETEDLHSRVPFKVSSSLPDNYFPRVELNFINCFNLDQEALLQQQPIFKRLILSGEEVPSYFTHHTSGTSLTNIPLLPTSLSQPFFRFMACTAIDSDLSSSIGHFPFLIEVFCRFIDNHGNYFGSAYWPLYFSTASMGSHLVIFNCCLRLNEDNAYLAKRNYDHIYIQFRLVDDYSQFKLKGCGIRLFESETQEKTERVKRRKRQRSRKQDNLKGPDNTKRYKLALQPNQQHNT